MSRAAQTRRDLLTLLVGALLLALTVGGWLLWNERARARRAEVLAGVPEFPARGQPLRHRPVQPALATPAAPPPVQAPAPLPQRRDRMAAFVLAPATTVALVQVNALLNSPLMARLRECTPDAFKNLEKASAEVGIDFERDIDRLAFLPGGVAVSGFFEGKPLAETLAGKGAPGRASSTTYRDQTIWKLGPGSCLAQLGNLLVMGAGDNCEPLVDRALDGDASPEQAQDLYGDLFVRTDLAALRREGSLTGLSGQEPLDRVVSSLDGVTLRANVWDEVSLTLDGQPGKETKTAELEAMGKGALALAKTQLPDDDAELQALAELAKVSAEDGKLHLDLALPGDQLFKRLHIPCDKPDAGVRSGNSP